MLWGFFGIVHIVSLIFGAGIIVGLHFLLKNKSEKTKKIVLFCCSLLGIGAIIFNLVKWGSPLEYLPLHLCSLSALIIPIAVLTKNKILGNLLLLWSLGAVFALVVNTAQANFEIFSATFFFYYFPHVFHLGIPILMFTLKLAKRDIKCILSTVAITMIAFTCAHFANVAINNYCVANNVLDYAGNLIQVNYMYSIVPENPLLNLFYGLIPHQYWYMYLIIPIIVIYLLVVYFDQFKALFKKNKQA